ncbi:MAG: hypothetical protein ACJ74K_00680 [Actinomycetes bacterium]
MAGGARRDGPAVLVDHLDHDQVLQDVHAGRVLAAGREDQGLGGPVEVQRLQPEGLDDAPAHVGGQHLGAGGDQQGAIRSRPWSCSWARAAATDGWAISASGRKP